MYKNLFEFSHILRIFAIKLYETMKRTTLFTILATLSLAAASCNSYKPHNERYTEGVSYELAEWRSSTIKNVSYDLHFDIAASRSEAVMGELSLAFDVEQSQEIVIDFRQRSDEILDVRANGKAATYEFRNEHIIIPEEAISAGRNNIDIAFVAGDQSINRNDDFLYTLLVPDRARTLFPCFDQPNIKASFSLSLTIPREWVAVSNTAIAEEQITDDRRRVTFHPTEPLSTYLFSFVAGRLDSRTYDDGHHRFTAYYRETDPKRLAQLNTIFAQVAASLEWLEDYTAIPYPFAKYDLVILPGFQYGGMEHTGATLYNDTQMFLGEHPTPDEELRRIELIAHETAHMWFGDYVTMAWFDDVWTKEVFANYFAARITEPLFPEVNHRLNFIKNYVGRSLAEDRTLGTTSIRQELDNLQNAGLVYGNIIYNKAPVMMEKLVEIMGEEAFREGIRRYLRRHAYGNATWDELIAILDELSKANLAAFSDVWVNRRGMPHISTSIEGEELVVTQHDPYGRSLLWPQSFACTAIGHDGTTTEVEITLYEREARVAIPRDTRHILPNSDGRGYGIFLVDTATTAWLAEHWASIEDATTRQAAAMALNENYELSRIEDRAWLGMLLSWISEERNPLIISTLCSYLSEPLRCGGAHDEELAMLHLAQHHALSSCRQQLLRTLFHAATSDDVVAELYDIWAKGEHPLLGTTDYMTLAYELAIRYPERYEAIVEQQRERITNGDRRRQFDYIIRACHPDKEMRDALFTELLEPENRRTEPWAAAALALLNHPLREGEAVAYIRRGLDELREVQRTGDIFFPRNWAGALLGNHRTAEAYREVQQFLEDNPQYPQLLKNKILQAADPLYRAQQELPMTK